MSAFIPNRRDPEVTEAAIARVREDKQREADEGFDGTWVAHPDLVTVALDVFDRAFGERPNQVERQRDDLTIVAGDLLDVRVPGAAFTRAELENNISVALRYIAAWLGGTGAAAINNLREDAATAEISRSQLWQWIRFGVRLDDGAAVTRELVRDVARAEAARLAAESPADAPHLEGALALLEATALEDGFVEFLTLPAYERLD
jgi:malate synthase